MHPESQGWCDYSDPDAVAKALRSVDVESPRGPVEISDKTHSPVQGVYISQVEEVDGELRNLPIKTYESVPPEGPPEHEAWAAHFRHDGAGRPE